MISAQSIKELREKTGAGVSDVKRALEEHGGDMAHALAALERKLGADAIKRAGRATQAGLVETYIHSNGKIGAMVEVLCETDFVARTPQFKELAHSIAMHIAAMAPLYLSLDTVPQEIWTREKERIREEADKLNKPSVIFEEIVDGKLKSQFSALSLLTQPFVKDQDKTVIDIVREASGRFGENIKVGRFARFSV